MRYYIKFQSITKNGILQNNVTYEIEPYKYEKIKKIVKSQLKKKE